MDRITDNLCPGCFVGQGSIKLCPHCGYDETAPRGTLLLPHRAVLHGQFVVGRVLGKPGGFGVTYLGWDLSLATRVAIKEYLPRDLAGRAADRVTIAAHTPEEDAQFRFGLEQFVREARTLAQLDHPNVVRVRHFFEANGTAYLVMDYYRGCSLAEHLERQGGRLPEEQAKTLMLPILDGLRAVHAKGFLHRDIKPQNIYLAQTDSGGVRPILLDFGAARLSMGERSRSLSVVLSPGFAPFEQYHRKGKQGPWTDLYGAAAVLYLLVTGEAPPEATERQAGEELKPAASFGVSQPLSDALDAGLALVAEERPQTMQQFQAQVWGSGVAKPPADQESDLTPKPPNQFSSSVEQPQAARTEPRETARSAPTDGAALPDGTPPFRRPKLLLAGSVAAFSALGLAVWYLSPPARSDEAAYAAAENTNSVAAYQDYLVGCTKDQCKRRADAQFNLGRLYATGRGVARDDHVAVQWYRQAAEQGHAPAQNNLGWMYLNGRGLETDDRAAAQWFRKGAELGDAAAQTNLGRCYSEGRGLNRSDQDAAQWFLQAARQGVAAAQYALGLSYAMGRGVERSDQEAAEWLRQAAQQDHVKAQFAVALMHLKGLGLPQDDVAAKQWLSKSAIQGEADAQVMLGAMYRDGRGGPQDDHEAIHWFRKAAEQGNADAQYNLGLMYEVGRGIGPSDSEAVEWYRKAAAQNRTDAAAALAKLERK